MNDAWTPNYDEVDATDLEVIGEIPADLNGIYVRNTENPVHDSIGVYHPFAGDGMLHSMLSAQRDSNVPQPFRANGRFPGRS